MRKKHSEKQCAEPWFEWERIRFPQIPEGWEKEIKAEAETDGDLMKSIPQLVCDFNFEVQKFPPSEELKFFIALKRMMAMMAQMAMKNDKVSGEMLHLTRRINWLTWGIFFLGIVTVVFMIFSYVQSR